MFLLLLSLLFLCRIRTKDEILKHHEQLQEEVAEDMIKMARSLKSSATLAKTIITNDNEVKLYHIRSEFL